MLAELWDVGLTTVALLVRAEGLEALNVRGTEHVVDGTAVRNGATEPVRVERRVRSGRAVINCFSFFWSDSKNANKLPSRRTLASLATCANSPDDKSWKCAVVMC